MLVSLLLSACTAPKTPDNHSASADGSADSGTLDTGTECSPLSASEQALYDDVWSTMNDEYPYFDYKGIDWAALGKECRQYVCGPDATYDSFIGPAMECLLGPLKDGHMAIVTGDHTSRRYYAFGAPTMDKVLIEGLLDPGSGALTPYTRTGTLSGGRIGYIRVDSWSDSALEGIDVGGLVDEVGPVQGMVLDARQNWGGTFENPERLVGRFTSDGSTPFGYYQSRDETDADPTTHELGPVTDMEIEEAYLERGQFEGPVALLIGPACFSSCESFVGMVVTLVPDLRLFGAATAASDSAYWSRVLPDGETSLYYSRYAQLKADGATFIEWTGFEPDEGVEFEGEGSDQVLSAAMAWLGA